MGDVERLQKLLEREQEKNRKLKAKLKELQKRFQYSDKREAPLEDSFSTESRDDNAGQEFSRERSELYRIFFEKSIDALFITTTDGRFVDANQAMIDLFGYSREEFRNLNAVQIYFKAQDREKFRRIMERNGSVKNYEHVLKTKNGELLDCLVTSTVWRKKDGTVGGYQGILRDITKQRQMERTILEGKTYFEQLFQSLPDAVVLTDNTSKIQRINKTFTKIFGYTEEEAVGKFLDKLVVPKELFEEGSGITKRTYQGETVYLESVRQRKDGTLFDVAILSAPFIVNENERAVYTVYRDNTERKRMEREIIKEKAYFEKLFDNSPEAVALADSSSRVLRINKTFTQMFGYTSEEAVGKSIDDLVVPEELIEEGSNITNRTAGGETVYVETVRKHKDGKRFDIVILCNQFSINENEQAIFGIYRDITEQKRMEREILKEKTYFEKLFNNSPEAVILADNNSRILRINKAFTIMFGYTLKESIGKSVDELIVPEELSEEGSDLTIRTADGETVSLETVRKRKDGKCFDVLILGAPFTISENEKAIYAIYRDISVHKRSERIQKALYDILDASTRAVTMADLLKMIHNAVGTLMDAKNFYVALYNEKTGMYSFMYHVDEYDLYTPDTPVSLDGGVTDYVRISKEPLLLNKEQYKEFKRKKGIQFIGKPAESWIGVPLISGNSAVGVAAVASYTNPDAYTQDDLIIFSFISGHIGLVVERKRAEEALYASEQRYRAVAESAYTGIVICDANNAIVYTNRSFSEMVGYKINELINMNISKFINFQMSDKRCGQKENEGDDDSDAYECVLMHKDGTPVYVLISVSSLTTEARQFMGSLKVFTNITSRKLAEKALKESEEKFRVLFENARDGILICNPKTMQLISANRKMCEFLGCSIDDIKNLTISDIHPKQELPDVIEKFKKIVLEEKSFVQSIPLLSKKGKITYMDVNGYNIIINGIECLVGVFRDATERIKLEQERLNRSKLDAVHNMIVTINHEMNQPLSVIKSYSDFLMKDIRAESSVREDVEIIYQETEKLAQLVKKMSSLKRIKFSEYSPSTQMVDLKNEQGDTTSMNAEENTPDISS